MHLSTCKQPVLPSVRFKNKIFKLLQTSKAVLLLIIFFAPLKVFAPAIDYNDAKWTALKYTSLAEYNQDVNNADELEKLEKNSAQLNNVRYGPNKEQPGFMLSMRKFDCEFTSQSSDIEILNSINSIEYEEFINGDKTKHINFMHRPLEKLVKGESRKGSLSTKLENINSIFSYKSYFIFAMTPAFTKVYNTKIKQKDNLELTPLEYATIRAHLVYIGSGQNKRPYAHIISTGRTMAGRFSKRAHPPQALHWLFAKALSSTPKTRMFDHILIVPFHGCNNYMSCAYSEFATIWAHSNMTMNAQPGDAYRFTRKLYIDKKEPRKYVKNLLSKKALQFVADFNMEMGIRQMPKSGQVMSLRNEIMEKDKKANNKLYRGASTVLNSQTSSKLKHYKFGSEIAYLQENGNYPAIVLPLEKINFQFNREIDRIRFVNKFRLHMKSKLSSIPLFLKPVETAIEKVLNSYSSQSITLKETLARIYRLMYHLNYSLDMTMSYNSFCFEFRSFKMSMYEAALEFQFFRELFAKNNELKFTSEETENARFSGEITFQTIPDTFSACTLKAQESCASGSNRNGQHVCEYCGNSFNDKHQYEKHIASEKRESFSSCPVCRKTFLSPKGVQVHELEPYHTIISIAQGVPPHHKSLTDKAVGRFMCPYHELSVYSPVFMYEEDLLEHMETHTEHSSATTRKDPVDRIESLVRQDKDKTGSFTCKYCGFKADTILNAKRHFGEVHLLHVGFDLDQIPNRHEVAKYLHAHYTIDGSKEVRKRGNFECKLDHLRFFSKCAVLNHLASKFHLEEFKENLKNSKYDELDNIENIRENVGKIKSEQLLDSSKLSTKKETEKKKLLEPMYRKISNNVAESFYWTSEKGQIISEPFSDMSRAYLFLVRKDRDDYLRDEELINEVIQERNDKIAKAKADGKKLPAEYSKLSKPEKLSCIAHSKAFHELVKQNPKIKPYDARPQ